MLKWYLSFFVCAWSLQSSLLCAVEKAPLFVISGGFSSCGYWPPDMHKSPRPLQKIFVEKMTRIETSKRFAKHFDEQNAHIIFVCFEFTRQGYPIGWFQYASSLSKLIGSPHRLENLEHARKVIRDSIEEHFHDRDVHLLGHSWGGTLVAKVAMDLASDISVASLLTADPIDHSCHLTGALIPAKVGRCRGAPFDRYQQRSILRRVQGRRWFHYYQETARMLRSGPMAARNPISSQLLFPPSERAVIKVSAHNYILGMEELWEPYLRSLGI